MQYEKQKLAISFLLISSPPHPITSSPRCNPAVLRPSRVIKSHWHGHIPGPSLGRTLSGLVAFAADKSHGVVLEGRDADD